MSDHSGGRFWTLFGTKLNSRAFSWRPFLFLFSASLLGALWHLFGRIFGVAWSSCLGHFAVFCADTAKQYKYNPSQAKTMLLGVLGVNAGIILANFLKPFLVLLSGGRFGMMLPNVGLQMGTLLDSILTEFADLE